MLLMAVLLMSCNTSKEILYFQDINVNQPEVISGARDITVQPKDQISILVSSKDPQLAALFNLARAQVRTELTHFTIILIISKILVKNILMVSYLYHLRLFSSIILCKASICIIAPS